MDSSNPSQTPQRSNNAQPAPEQQTPVTNSAVQAVMDQPTDARPAPEHAYWAEIEEDLSVPDEAEIKEIESKADNDTSATKYDHWEKTFYPDLGDPEYKPVEKSRLSWKLKGVRGTKECPNWATVMRSPPAYIGGYWWTIKFFPRGNKANSLSIYLECSSSMPTPDRTLPESEFKVLRGAPDATLNDCTPDLDLKTEKTDDSTAWLDMYKSKYPPAAASQERSQAWRVAAQVAVIIYNPDEPRTGWMQSSCHQFNPHNLDWGWTDFHGPWDKVHMRQRGQRQPLLRNDTLAFDAYIRIIDDPTNSLWWHRSVTENTWDSLGITGYRPLGDSGINHRAEVAGLASWLHIAPFCKIIQSVDTLEHLTNCEIKPKPLCDALQKVLWMVRSRSGSQYVNTDVVTATLRNLNEYSSDVSEFWERLRRGLELELAGTKAGEEFAKLFDSPSVAQLPGAVEPLNTLPPDYNSRICVQADEVKTTGEALTQYFSTKPGRWALPPVLNIELNRHKLDQATKQWRLLYNRVDPDEELDLTEQVAEGQCGRYVLYGYVVHRGRRTSGKFFSILRPGGPGTRWFAFDDGSSKRVECLTRKTALGPHLGLDVSKKPDQKTGHDVAVVMMYIRSDVVGEFLPGPQGPWDAPEDMREYYETGEYPFNRIVDGKPAESDLQLEVYSLPNYDEIGSLFDTYDLMSRAKSSNNVMYLSVPRSSTFVDLRNKVSLWKSSGGDAIPSEHVRLWQIGHTLDRHGSTLAFSRVSSLNDTLDLPAKVARFWMQVVSGEEAKYFAMPDPPNSTASAQKPMPDGAVVEQRSSQSIHEVDDSVDPALPEQSSGTVSNDGQPSAPTPPSSMEENPDSDAVFARRIANEIRQMDVAAASEAAQQQEQQTTPDATAELTIQTRSTEASAPATAIQLPVPHVYYFLQLFNADTQSFRTMGTFFSHANENIKSALLTHLPNPPKDIIIYQRTETTTLTSLSANGTFNPVSTPDGTTFIVSERLSTEKRTSLHTAGNFSTLQPLITYLWASSRNHPTQSFTGTTTLPASFSTDSYTGTLLKGHYHGHGTHINPLGSTYTGAFTFSLRHGHGTMTYPSGDTYTGTWAHDVPHGQGTYIEAKTGNKYVGGYKDGKRHGKGVSYWEVADEEADLCSICYGGEKDAVFIGCGHVCACVGCAELVDLCPICRRGVQKVVRIYRT